MLEKWREKKVWGNLDFFMKIILNSENLVVKKPNDATLRTMYDISTDKNCEDEALKHNINELSKKVKIVYDDIIKNQNLFPMRLMKLSPLIINIFNNQQEEYKQGDSKKIIQELCGK